MLKNQAHIGNMIVEATDIIAGRDTILYDYTVTICRFQRMCEDIGCILDVLRNYSK